MKYQFMPMFWGDFFANTLHLTAQEIGAYLLLIGHAWEHGGKVHYNDARRVARVRADHWPKVWKRLEPFFEWDRDPIMGTPTWGTHHRVHRELLNAAEISSKRKDAALQMHTKRSANAHAKDPHLHLQLLKEPLCEEGSAKPVPTRPQPTAAWHPRIDETDDYRSPPREKSDNDLGNTSRDDLKALAAKKG